MFKFLLAVEIDEKGHTDRDLIFEEYCQESLEKSNAKNGHDLDVANMETFIDEFKNKKIKKLEDKIKEKEGKIKQKNKRTRSQTKRTRRQI